MTTYALKAREDTIERDVAQFLDFAGGKTLILAVPRPVRRKPEFKAIAIDTRGFKFDRESANRR